MRERFALAALVVAVCATVAPLSAADRSVVPRTPICTTSELKIGVVRSYAGLSHAGAYISFTNRASTPCHLTGWPTLIALTSAGKRTSARHVRSIMFGSQANIKGVPVVTLRHNSVAYAPFGGTDNPYNAENRKCPSTIRRLRITPPGNSSSVLRSAWIRYLNSYLPACQTLEVTMILPASDLTPCKLGDALGGHPC